MPAQDFSWERAALAGTLSGALSLNPARNLTPGVEVGSGVMGNYLSLCCANIIDHEHVLF